jgi:hypothetical protein
MQQLKVEHENTTEKCRRKGKGRVLAISRRIYRLQNTDVFYVESESSDNTYYFVKFKPDVVEWCSCCDNSMRGLKCKHIWSIEFAIRLRIIKDTDILPTEAKVKEVVVITTTPATKPTKSYKDDDYSF